MSTIDWACRTCGSDDFDNRARGECHTCYWYRLRTGQPRPAYLFGAPRFCANCGFAIPPAGQGRRCRACAQYEWRHGCARPAEMWNPRRAPVEVSA